MELLLLSVVERIVKTVEFSEHRIAIDLGESYCGSNLINVYGQSVQAFGLYTCLPHIIMCVCSTFTACT